MITHHHRRRAAMRPTALAAVLLLQGLAQALPEDGRGSFGQTQLTRTDGQTLRIDQSTARAGIDWRSFSIGAGELVRVVQPDGSSVLVNRVTGLDPSVILGRLQANGRVFLTNPRGVIFGEGAQVDVGGLVATTLSLSDADAQAGRWWLRQEGGAAAVRNDGTINAAGGVALLGAQVGNSGSITAGRIALGAVSEARVDLDGDGLILFNTRAADAARLDQLGTLRAGAGRIELTALARGQVAGSVLNLRGAVFAQGLDSRGGEVVINGGGSGIVEVGASVDVSAAAGRGGHITLLGDKLLLDDGARLDASGRDGGGQIRVGGDFHGASALLPNAAMVVARNGARLDVSATGHGDGGSAVVWSDQGTRFAGTVDARGGALGGDGGMVEVSGKAFLDYAGRSDRSAPLGRAGTLLLDPTNLTIQATAPDILDNNSNADLTSPSLAFTAPGTNSRITAGAVLTQLAAGSVVLQANNNIDVNAAINAAGASSLTLQAGNNITIAAPVSVGGNLTLSVNDPGSTAAQAGGAVTVNAALTSGGTLTISRNSSNGGTGVHQIGAALNAATLAVDGDLNLTSNLTLTLSGTSALAAGITGSGFGITKAGAGTLTLGGANTSTGGTTVSAGTLALGAATALGGGTLVVDGGTLDLGGGSATVSGLRQSGGSIVNGTLTSQSDFDLRAGTASAALAGAVGLNKTTSGSHTLSGNNLYTGATTVAAGTLVAASNQALGSVAGNTTVNAGATLELANASIGSEALVLAGTGVGGTGALLGSGNSAAAGGVTLSADTTVGGSGQLVLSGAVGGSAALTKAGSGALILGSTGNSYGGATNIVAGTLALGASNVLPNTTTVTVAGGTLDIGANSDTVAGVTLQSGNITGTTGTLASLSAFNLESGAVSAQLGGAVGLNKSGPGSATLSGTNTYTGTTTIGGGTLVASNNQALGSAAAGTVVASGATLELDSVAIGTEALTLAGSGDNGNGALLGSGTSSSTGSITLSASTDIASSGVLTLSGAIGGAGGSLSKTGSGLLTLASTGNSYGGATDIVAGTLALGASNVLPNTTTVTVNGGTLQIGGNNDTVAGVTLRSGVLSGSGGTLTSLSAFDLQSGLVSASLGGSVGLNKTGAGTVTLSGASTYAGATTVSAGRLATSASERIPNGSALTVDTNAVFDIAGNETVANLTLSGTLDGLNQTLSAASYALQGGTVNANLGSGALSSSGTSALNGSALSSTVNVSSGTLTLGSANRLLSGVGVSVGAGATLALGGSEGLSALSGSGTVALDNGGTLTLDTQSNQVFAGRITGSGDFVKNGSADFTLGAASPGLKSSYSGDTTVNAGRLLIGLTDALPTGTSLFVANGADFNLNGFNQTVASFSGGSVRGTGTLTAGSFSMDSGGTDSGVTLGGNTLDVAGSFTLNGPSTAQSVTVFNGGVLSLGSSGNLLDDAADVSVFSGGELQMQVAERVGSFTLSGTLSGTGTLTAATYALGGGAFVGTNLGTGIVTVTGSATLAAQLDAASALVVDGGSLDLGGSRSVASVQLLAGAINNGTLTSANAFDLRSGSVNASLAGSQGLSKAGTGAVALNNGNTYGGTTTVGAGTLTVANAGALGATGAANGTTVSAGASLVLDGVGIASEALTLSGSGVSGNGALQGLGSASVGGSTVLSASTSIGGSGALALNGAVSGPGALNKVGGGTLTLSSNGNSYGGTTGVGGGTLRLGSSNVLPDSTVVTVTSGALDIGANNDSVAGVSLLGGAISGSGGVLSSTSAFDVRSGSVSANLGGTVGLNKTGSGTVTLSGGNSYIGTTAVSDGTLGLGASNVIGDSSALVVNAPGILAMAGFSDTVAAVQLNGGTISGSASGQLSSATAFEMRSGSVSAGLGGTVGLNKTTTGTLTLSGASSYGGTTAVGAGTLVAASNQALGSAAGGTTVAASATLELANANIGAEALAVNGGLVTATGTSASSGGVTLAQGASFGGSGSLVLGGAVSGAAVLNKIDGGNLTLSNAGNSFGGAAIVGGTLTLGADNVLPNGGSVTLTGGTLAMGAFNDSVAGVSLQAGAITGSGLLTSTSNFDMRSGSVSARLGGTVGLDKTGSGSVTLSGSNTYSGATTVNDGTLALGNSNVIDNSSALVVNGGSFAAGIHSDTFASVTLNGGTITGSTTGQLSSTAAFELRSGTVSAGLGGSSGLNKTGTGAVTLSGANNYSGATLVGAGTLVAASNQALGSTAGGTTVSSGATLELSNASIGAETLTLAGSGVGGAGALLGSGTAASGGSVVLAGDTAFGGSGTLALSGAVSGNFALNKVGSGTLALSGGGSSYGGATNVNAGTLALAASEVLPDSTAVSVAAGATLNAGFAERVASLNLAGTLVGAGTVTAASYTVQGGSVIDANLGTGVLLVNGSTRLNGTSGATTVQVNAGTLTLGSADRLADTAGVSVASGAALALGGNDTVGSLVLAGTLQGSGTLSAATYALQAGTVTANLGGGTLTSDGASQLTGTAAATVVAVDSGTLNLASANRLADTARVTVADGATLRLNGSDTVGSVAVSGTLDGSGTLTAASYALSGGVSNVDLGSGSLSSTGASQLNGLSAAGAVQVVDGTLAFGSAGRLTAAPALNVTGGATLALAGSETLGSLGGAGVLNLGNGTLSTGTLADSRFDGVIAGNGSLNKIGSTTTFTLAGAATYAGATTVSAGTLATAAADRLPDTSQLTVARGASLVLGGNDTVAGLALAGTVAGSGTLSAATYVLDSGTVNANLGGGSLQSSGSSSINGTAAAGTITVAGGQLAVAGSGTLTGLPDLDVQAGELLLAGNQSVGAVSGAGTLSTGPLLAATTVNSSGTVNLGGTISTTGSQTYGGAVRGSAGSLALLAADGADIVATNSGNDFGSGTLALRGRSVRLFDGGSELGLGTVVLGSGTSDITGQGAVRLFGGLALGDGVLTLASRAAASDGAAATTLTGGTAYLPEPANGAQSNRSLVYAADAIGQATGAAITTSAASTLHLRAENGASITLQDAGNQLGGGISATSGGSAAFNLAGDGRVSRVAISADRLHLVAAVDGSGDAVRADVVNLSAAALTGAAGASIRARLPYSANQGIGSQLAGLTIDTRPFVAGSAAGFGSLDAPIGVVVGSTVRGTGIGGLYLSVLPAPEIGVGLGQQVYLGCLGCTSTPVYQYGGIPTAVQTYFNGRLIEDPPLPASVITNNTTLLENARRSLFEGAVRTENVGPRLRNGVVAEVGKGRPATEGTGGAARPAACAAAAGTLACGGKE